MNYPKLQQADLVILQGFRGPASRGARKRPCDPINENKQRIQRSRGRSASPARDIYHRISGFSRIPRARRAQDKWKVKKMRRETVIPVGRTNGQRTRRMSSRRASRYISCFAANADRIREIARGFRFSLVARGYGNSPDR